MPSPSCQSCGQNFAVTERDLKFYERVSPTFNGQKYKIPPPTLCPNCRQQRRLAICNEFNLHPATCALCSKKLITEYEPGSPYTVYCRDCFYSDQFKPTDYGRDYDFNRPFFEQFNELQKTVPVRNLKIDGTNVNCDYIHYAGGSKNCYLIMHADFCENCYYGYGFKKSTSCVDGFYNLHCELCYDCVDCHKCYDLKGSQDCINCHSSAFLRDCIGCKNCFLCVGLRQKEFCFQNQQLSKAEYQKKLAAIDLGSYSKYQQFKPQRTELEKKHTFKAFHGHNLQNCLGDYLYNCKNVTYSFDCEDVENAQYCFQVVLGAKDIYDIYQYGTNLQQSYEGAINGENGYHLLFCFSCDINCSDMIYCANALSAKNCFGSVSLKHNRYCILNKQYTQEEYEKMVPKIIAHMQKTGEWGEFFPMQTSCFGYNKTSAQLYYPLKKEAALKKGAPWSNHEATVGQNDHVIPAAKLPDHIQDITDDILNGAIECETTKKLFKITALELKFYRQQNLPLPRRSPFKRHLDRFHLRNPRYFWKRPCAKCGQTIQSTYSPDRPETVYCEPCYLENVY